MAFVIEVSWMTRAALLNCLPPLCPLADAAEGQRVALCPTVQGKEPRGYGQPLTPSGSAARDSAHALCCWPWSQPCAGLGP